MKVGLYKNKKRFTRCVHRLVAIAFIPNPENLPEVNHKNGVKPNNFDYNLKWCTKSENQQHAYDNGLNHGCMGENNGRSKLMESDVLEIRKLFSDKKMNYRQVAENFGVTKSAVWAIVHNKTWKHI
jgi:predicted XRE-type DNA-binding protein